jgi:hypothetical protein
MRAIAIHRNLAQIARWPRSKGHMVREALRFTCAMEAVGRQQDARPSSQSDWASKQSLALEKQL